MTIDHIGIVVPRLEEGLSQWEARFGYRRRSAIVMNSRQKVRVVVLGKPNSLPVKLLEPAGAESPAYHAALRGGGLHHVCFRCAGIAPASS